MKTINGSESSDSIPPEYTRRMMRQVLGWAIAAAPSMLVVVAGVWALHQEAKAQAVQIARAEVRLSQIERSLAKIDTMADDVTAIKAALGVEQGWRRGLMQSLPGAESE